MPRIVKWLLLAVAIAAAVVMLFLWVFPWVESLQQDPTLGVGTTEETVDPVVPLARSPWAQEARSPR